MSAQDGAAHRIVVGVDGSLSAVAALRWAAQQAARTGAGVDAVLAWEYRTAASGFGHAPADMMDSDPVELAENMLADAITEAVGPDSSVRVRPLIVSGHPTEVLLKEARDADLLVVGSRGHGGFAGALLGSVTQHCVQHADCPVVIVRAGAAGGPAAR